ncbi:MAG TPA: PadR family transcriptional regulator [Bryobacteraceae bacterium]|nr:PadR family transcriptional regulator [Bryobacteraceae bacterium]
MPRYRNDTLRGTLTLLVLRSLEARGPMHGYALCEHLQSVSSDLLRVEEGSLYPALHRMEQDGSLSASWHTTAEGRKAKLYNITPCGKAQLQQEKESWDRLIRGVGKVLRYC